MRRTIPAALAAVTAFAAAAAFPALAAPKRVTVGDDWFVKPGGGTVSVTKGTTVRWVFSGRRKHTVVGTGAGSFIDSGAPKRSGAYALKVDRKGTFKIICTLHGNKQRMTLKVR
jgi:plastocyanin